MSFRHVPPSVGGRRIFLAIPSYGSPSGATSFSLFQSHPALIDAGLEVELSILSGYCHVDDGRNILVSHFLESGCDELMFIDADIGWHVEEMVRFVSHDRDVVAGTYPQRSDTGRFPCQYLEGDLRADSAGLLEVKGVPTGFLKIKRHVLERLFGEARQYTEAGRPTAEIFERDVIAGDRISGDLNFCRKWRAMGGKIYVDPELHLQHVGEKTWQGTFGSYLRKLNGLDLVRGIEKIRARQFERSDVFSLYDEWGDDEVGHEFLTTCIEAAYQAMGPVIAFGLPGLCMAATGAEVHVPESRRMIDAKKRLDLDTLYFDTPKQADIVVTAGKVRGRPRCIIHTDRNYIRDGYRAEVMGQLRPFAVLK